MNLVHRFRLALKNGFMNILNYNSNVEEVMNMNLIKNVDIDNKDIYNDSDYKKEAAIQEALYTGKSQYVRSAFKSSKSGHNLFWEVVDGKEIQGHHAIVPMVIEYYGRIVSSNLEQLRVEDEDIQELIDEIFSHEEQQHINDIIKEITIKTLVYGDVCLKLEFDSTISDYPIITVVPGLNVDYKVRKNRIVECIFNELYRYNGESYVLKERRGRGYIYYHLFNNKGKEVPVSTIPELVHLNNLEYDDNRMLAIPFKIKDHPVNTMRGKPLFYQKTDDIQRLDETINSYNINVRKAEPLVFMDSRLIEVEVGTGTRRTETGHVVNNSVKRKLPIKGETAIVMQSDRISGSNDLPKMIEYVNIPLNSEEYHRGEIMDINKVLFGIISPESLGLEPKTTNDNATAQKDREKITVDNFNEIVDSLTPMLKQLVNTTLSFYSLIIESITEENVDFLNIGDISIGFKSYGSETIADRIDVIYKARGGAEKLMSEEASVRYLHSDKNEEWIEEELHRLDIEKHGSIDDLPEPPLLVSGLDDYSRRKKLEELEDQLKE